MGVHAVRANAKYLIAILLSAFVVSYLLLSTGAEARNVVQVGPYLEDDFNDALTNLFSGDFEGYAGGLVDVGIQLADLATSGNPADVQTATDLIKDHLSSEDGDRVNAITRVLEFASQRADNAVQVAETAGTVLETNDAALFFSQFDPDRIIREDPPIGGFFGWIFGSLTPPPLDQVLLKLSTPSPGALVTIEDVVGTPVAQLPAGEVLLPLTRLTPVNFREEDIIATHVTFFAEKSWLEDNGIHPWSVNFNRYDEDSGKWVAYPGKLVREDADRIFYTVQPDRFSIWAVSGESTIPPLRFQADNLSITPALAAENQNIVIQAQVTNLTQETADYNSVLWINDQVYESRLVTIGANATVPVSFNVQLDPGFYTTRIDRVRGPIIVSAGPIAPGTVSPLAAFTELEATGNLEIASSFNYGTGKYEAYVPGLPGNSLTGVQPSSVIVITLTESTTVVVSGISYPVRALVPTPLPVGADVTILVR